MFRYIRTAARPRALAILRERHLLLPDKCDDYLVPSLPQVCTALTLYARCAASETTDNTANYLLRSQHPEPRKLRSFLKFGQLPCMAIAAPLGRRKVALSTGRNHPSESAAPTHELRCCMGRSPLEAGHDGRPNGLLISEGAVRAEGGLKTPSSVDNPQTAFLQSGKSTAGQALSMRQISSTQTHPCMSCIAADEDNYCRPSIIAAQMACALIKFRLSIRARGLWKVQVIVPVIIVIFILEQLLLMVLMRCEVTIQIFVFIILAVKASKEEGLGELVLPYQVLAPHFASPQQAAIRAAHMVSWQTSLPRLQVLIGGDWEVVRGGLQHMDTCFCAQQEGTCHAAATCTHDLLFD